jgi:dihydropteroate synthase
MKALFPKIMGIINVTPDSFSDGGKFTNKNNAISHALSLLEKGADIIDIGGESTRPGAAEVEENEEIERTIPVVEAIIKERPDAYISIDTSKSNVAELALKAGVKMVNDVTGLRNAPKIADLVADNNADLCIMHMIGSPRTMQKDPKYDDLIGDIYNFLLTQTKFAISKGVKNIFVDVGIGFGKTVQNNIDLLKNIEKFNDIGSGQLLGISRKSFIGKALNIDKPSERDISTALIHSLLLSKNLKIIRVHNVDLFIQLKKIFKLLQD